MKLLLFAFILYPLYLPSQVLTGYNNGFVITNSNDTVYGLLKLRNNFPYRLFNNAQFKRTEDAQSQSFTPGEIKGFIMGSEIYESKYLSNKKVDKGFFQLKIKGFLSYYEREYYVWPQTKNSYKVILQKEDADQVFIYDVGDFFFPFKRKLSEYLKECPKLASKIKNNIYNQVHIVRIVNEYNDFVKSKQIQN